MQLFFKDNVFKLITFGFWTHDWIKKGNNLLDLYFIDQSINQVIEKIICGLIDNCLKAKSHFSLPKVLFQLRRLRKLLPFHVFTVKKTLKPYFFVTLMPQSATRNEPVFSRVIKTLQKWKYLVTRK